VISVLGEEKETKIQPPPLLVFFSPSGEKSGFYLPYIFTGYPLRLKEEFAYTLDEKLFAVGESLWYADTTNFKAGNIVPYDLEWHQKRKFFKDANHYLWDDPYLFKVSTEGLIRRCVVGKEANRIMWHCHSSAYGGHHSGERTAAKLLQSDFWWQTLFKDCQDFVKQCDKFQRTGNITKRNEMPLTSIIEIEPFDCQGIDFMRLFPSSYFYLHILVCVDYVTKWVEAIPCVANDAKTVVNVLKKNIFTRVETPRVLISDGGKHFFNNFLETVLKKYNIKHKVATLYHHQTGGRVEVSNHQLKQI